MFLCYYCQMYVYKLYLNVEFVKNVFNVVSLGFLKIDFSTANTNHMYNNTLYTHKTTRKIKHLAV